MTQLKHSFLKNRTPHRSTASEQNVIEDLQKAILGKITLFGRKFMIIEFVII